MRWIEATVICVLLSFPATGLMAQAPNSLKTCGMQNSGYSSLNGSDTGVPSANARQSILAWTPPALEAVAQRAEVRNSFTLDRTMLGAMLAIMPESDERVRPAIRKLDGISVRLYRFHELDQIDQAEVEDVRRAYRARGWQHIGSEGPMADPGRKRTDLWLTLDGMTVRGGAMMLVTPKSVSVVTFVGELNPVDVLRLRGHFGIPAAGDDSPVNTR